jgi:hypothetical protein
MRFIYRTYVYTIINIKKTNTVIGVHYELQFFLNMRLNEKIIHSRSGIN